MNFAWILFFFILAMVCMERTQSANCPHTCTRSSKKVNKIKERCGWMWQNWCTKQSKYYIDHDYYTCYKPCPINGSWGRWSNWGSWNRCVLSQDTKCGEQTKKRRRYCNNPSPQYGGNYCHGHGTQMHSKTCPLKGTVKPGGWSSWGPWISLTPCSQVCGKGTKIMIKKRYCNNPKPKCGGICQGMSFQFKPQDCDNHCGSRAKAILKKSKN